MSSCLSIGVSFDDSFIVTGHMDGNIKFWSHNDKPDKVLDAHEDKIHNLELIKNENQLLTISK
jgi:hypothetical protein